MTAPIQDISFALCIADRAEQCNAIQLRAAVAILGDAYRMSARREAIRVRVTPESAEYLQTVANAMQKAIRAYREWQADPTPGRKAKAMRKAELYERHRRNAYRAELTRQLGEALTAIESRFR